MGLISPSTLLEIADRAAYQMGQIIIAFESINISGTNGFYEDIVIATEDVDVLIPLLETYTNTDHSFDVIKTVTNGMPYLTAIVLQMNVHFDREGQVGSWDGYLKANSIQVSDYFNQLYRSAGGYYMLANNVFSEGYDLFGTVEVVLGPVISYTDGINYGDGSWDNFADGSHFAPTQLRIIVQAVGGAGPGMANDLDLMLGVKDPNNDPTTIDVTVPAGSIVGDIIEIGTTSNRFLDVISADFVPLGSQGTVGDTVEIVNQKERQITP